MHFRLIQAVVCLSLATAVQCVSIPGFSGFEIKDKATFDVKGKRSIEVRDGVEHTVFEHEETGATLDFVTNSGICETTPGVNQYSGYLSVGKNQSMWFWFFESRNQPHTAPLALWVNGGPGCSSMIGLFQENGPCTFNNNETLPSLNPYSWNEYANMLYVDQPIGVGFSYGNDTVYSTASAAPPVWTFLQAFFANFQQYKSREFGLFTESYGGHYGPSFASYFEQQNAAIYSGKLKATPINLVALGINNGWYDAIIQEREFINFSVNNSYYPLINQTIADEYMAEYQNTSLPALEKCTSIAGEVPECYAARAACIYVDDKYGAYYSDDFDYYDIRQPASAPFPPETYVTYLSDPEIMKKIGAKVQYQECPDAVHTPFSLNGDTARSFLPALSSVVQSGITTVIWAGDADATCDWFGGFYSANAIKYAGQSIFEQKPVSPYTVKGGVGGEFKNVGALSWLRVYESGHEIPAFKPELALQVFKQTMQKTALHST